MPRAVPSSKKSSVLDGSSSLMSGPSGVSSLMATPPQRGLKAGAIKMVGFLAVGNCFFICVFFK